MTPRHAEILRQCAEAMGWTAREDEDGFWSAVEPIHGMRPDKWISERNVWSFGMPDYTTDANAAITLCDHLARQGWNCNINQGTDGTWECTFTRDIDKEEVHYGPGPTFCEAITEAFLRVKGLWPE